MDGRAVDAGHLEGGDPESFTGGGFERVELDGAGFHVALVDVDALAVGDGLAGEDGIEVDFVEESAVLCAQRVHLVVEVLERENDVSEDEWIVPETILAHGTLPTDFAGLHIGEDKSDLGGLVVFEMFYGDGTAVGVEAAAPSASAGQGHGP